VGCKKKHEKTHTLAHAPAAAPRTVAVAALSSAAPKAQSRCITVIKFSRDYIVSSFAAYNPQASQGFQFFSGESKRGLEEGLNAQLLQNARIIKIRINMSTTRWGCHIGASPSPTFAPRAFAPHEHAPRKTRLCHTRTPPNTFQASPRRERGRSNTNTHTHTTHTHHKIRPSV
jgi:hypothetical protein